MSHDIPKSIPVVILAGGLGTRLGESSDRTPKPLVRIGNYPILLHIISGYLKYGYTSFIICAGYKAGEFKRYFSELDLEMNNQFFSFKNAIRTGRDLLPGTNDLRINSSEFEVAVIDTGLETTTAGRIAKIRSLVSSDYFLCTYGDGVSSLNINELVKYHLSGSALATLTAFHPPSRFGEIDIDNNGCVTSFREKQLTASYVNGGFFVFDKSVFDLIDPELSLEEGLLSKLSAEGKLRAYLSEDYWQMMDTPREVELLNKQIQQGSAPWLT